MFENKATVLLSLSQDGLDRARVVAGKATTALKLPVSLQIVLRALIEEGLKQDHHPALLANIEGQAKAVRHKRSLARRAGALVGVTEESPVLNSARAERARAQRRRK